MTSQSERESWRAGEMPRKIGWQRGKLLRKVFAGTKSNTDYRPVSCTHKGNREIRSIERERRRHGSSYFVAWHGSGSLFCLLLSGGDQKPTTVHSLSACLFYEGRFQQPAQKDSGHARTDIVSVVTPFPSPQLSGPFPSTLSYSTSFCSS